MLKDNPETSLNKKGVFDKAYEGPLSSGLNRRDFLKTSIAITLLSGFIGCKPKPSETTTATAISNSKTFKFSKEQRQILDRVQIHLFPEDGDGPNAQDLNALSYLEWALTDEKNISDGDADYITKGIVRLNELSTQIYSKQFVTLRFTEQDKILQQTAKNRAGESWMSLLMYYLTEALLLDPIYGGNPNGIGWKWLEHQAGFPQPVVGKTYRDFKNI